MSIINFFQELVTNNSKNPNSRMDIKINNNENPLISNINNDEELIEKILHSKDYYDILGIPKNSNEIIIKNVYKKVINNKKKIFYNFYHIL